MRRGSAQPSRRCATRVPVPLEAAVSRRRLAQERRATSPISTQYDPYALARIQAFDDELNKWFGMFESDPGILYVSDGNPNTVTVPNDLHPWLVDTLDESKIGNRKLVRY